MKKPSLKERIEYKLDLWLSKSTSAMLLLLFAITGIIIVILGLFAWLVTKDESNIKGSLWAVFMHTLDPGVVSGDTGSAMFLFIMVLATLAGVFFLALLIGFINDGIQSRIEDFSKGLEPVIESGHTLILGFNEATMVIINELIEANANQGKRRNVLVVMDKFEKKEMEDKIAMRFSDTGNVEVICRSGSIFSSKDLHRCSILTCKSIIIAEDDDFENIKAILACTQILNDSDVKTNGFVTAVINKRENERAAQIAGFDVDTYTGVAPNRKDRLELLLLENEIARIMVHTCRQTGLTKVFEELFNFDGCEFYIPEKEDYEHFLPEIEGKTIREINHHLTDAIAVGVLDEYGTVVIDDPNKVVFNKNRRLILLEEDDDSIKYRKEVKIQKEIPSAVFEDQPINVLVLGGSTKLTLILEEMQYYLSPGSHIHAADCDGELHQFVPNALLEVLEEKGITITVNDNYKINDCERLSELIDFVDPQFIMILSKEMEDANESDKLSLELLLYVHEYRRKHAHKEFGLTCEMKIVENQQLVEMVEDSDFIISRNVGALMMAQISETRELMTVFDTLLSSEGFEVYIKSAKYYLGTGKEVDYYSIVDAVADKGEIFIGYMEESGNEKNVIVNPPKMSNGVERTLKIDENTKFIVLAEDREVVQG